MISFMASDSVCNLTVIQNRLSLGNGCSAFRFVTMPIFFHPLLRASNRSYCEDSLAHTNDSAVSRISHTVTLPQTNPARGETTIFRLGQAGIRRRSNARGTTLRGRTSQCQATHCRPRSTAAHKCKPHGIESLVSIGPARPGPVVTVGSFAATRTALTHEKLISMSQFTLALYRFKSMSTAAHCEPDRIFRTLALHFMQYPDRQSNMRNRWVQFAVWESLWIFS